MPGTTDGQMHGRTYRASGGLTKTQPAGLPERTAGLGPQVFRRPPRESAMPLVPSRSRETTSPVSLRKEVYMLPLAASSPSCSLL